MDERLIKIRDILSYSKLKGEELTKVERAIVSLVDELFEAAHPNSSTLPQDVLLAIDEIKRIRHATIPANNNADDFGATNKSRVNQHK